MIRHSSFVIRHSAAFTLLELVLAMAITSVIALSVAGVSLALSTSYAQTQGFYTQIQTGRGAMNTMQASLRKAKLITGVSSTGLLFWARDAEGAGQGQINREEMALWVYDAASHELREACIVYPSDAKALNTALPLSTALAAPTTNSLPAKDTYSQWKVIATDVRDFRVAADQPPPLTRCVKLQLTIGDGTRQVTLESAVRLRADATEQVSTSSGSYILDAAVP